MKTQTIDITPTWTEVLPILTFLIKSKKQSDQLHGYSQLTQMAKAADLYNVGSKKKSKKKGSKNAKTR